MSWFCSFSVSHMHRCCQRDCAKIYLLFQARQKGSDALVFEDVEDGEVWDHESRVATQPVDLQGAGSGLLESFYGRMPARHPGNACAGSCTTSQKGVVCSSLALGCCRGAGAGRGEGSIAGRRSRYSECVLKRARCTFRPSLCDSSSMVTHATACPSAHAHVFDWCTSIAKGPVEGRHSAPPPRSCRQESKATANALAGSLADDTTLPHTAFCWAFAAISCILASAVSIPDTNCRGCM